MAKNDKTEPLIGYFAYEGGSERYSVSIYVTVRDVGNGKFSLALMAAHPDGHGAAPDGDGEGTIDSEGKLRFDYQDSFSNKGSGTFKRTREGYLLLIEIDHYEDRRCSFFYGEHVLQRNLRDKHPRGISDTPPPLPKPLASAQERRTKSSTLLGSFRISDAYAKETRIIIDVSVTRTETGYRLNFQGMGAGGRGHAPEGSGQGMIGKDGIFRFEFRDSFLNHGSGTFAKVKDHYVLHIDISDISNPDVMMFYGEDIPMRRE